MKSTLSKIGTSLMLLYCIAGMQACNVPKYSDLQGDYFGQPLPGIKAEIFAPSFISLPDRGEYAIAFSPDGNECYISCNVKNTSSIFYTKRVNNTWIKQSEISFLKDQKFDLSHLSADGNTIYLEKDKDIWKSERKAGSWSEPERLPSPVNSASNDHGYSTSSDGIMYIGSSRPAGSGNSLEIWRIVPSSDNAENLGPVINSTQRNLTPCIAPDGSYLIFTQSDTSYEYLCISFDKGNSQWTEPVNMDMDGARINISTYQNRPSLSPDGKYLFFNSHGAGNAGISDIYWVSTEIIANIRNEVIK